MGEEDNEQGRGTGGGAWTRLNGGERKGVLHGPPSPLFLPLGNPNPHFAANATQSLKEKGYFLWLRWPDIEGEKKKADDESHERDEKGPLLNRHSSSFQPHGYFQPWSLEQRERKPQRMGFYRAK